jgi:hypothetical protein
VSISANNAGDIIAPVGILSGFGAYLGYFPVVLATIGTTMAIVYYGLAILNDPNVQYWLDLRRKAKIEKYRKKIAFLQTEMPLTLEQRTRIHRAHTIVQIEESKALDEKAKFLKGEEVELASEAMSSLSKKPAAE